MESSTYMTVKLLRKYGWRCQLVERWNPYAKRRIDLFGIIDVVCLDGSHIIGVQCTTGTNHANHLTKITQEAATKDWLESGGKLLLVSWRKTAKKQKKKWLPRAEWITYENGQFTVADFFGE